MFILLLILCSTRLLAQPAASSELSATDQAFIAARNAVVKMDARAFEAAAPAAARHPMAEYIDYWRLRLLLARVRADSPTDLARSADQQARAFIDRHANDLVADLARRDWLLTLGRRAEWGMVDQVAAAWRLKDDTPAKCIVMHARALRGEDVMPEARPLLMAPRELGDACNALLEHVAASGLASMDTLRTRLERALESGSVSAIRRAALLALPEIDHRRLEAALSEPTEVLKSGKAGREQVWVALSLIARKEPLRAANLIEQPAASRLSPSERELVLAIAAGSAMRDLSADAIALARRAPTVRASDDLLGELARAGLMAVDWAMVRSAIERMSPVGQADTTWTYWLARSLLAQGSDADTVHRARVLLTGIMGPTGFYSQLAAEELGARLQIPPRAPVPTETELNPMRSNPGLERAARFYALGLRIEGHREWNFQLRGMTDRQLLAAAEWGRQLGHLDRMINSSDRTRDEHDYTQRYPTPFIDRLQPAAQAQGLEAAWVYGLIRQESRFIMDARSSVGASGLMQIMPATAKWIASQLGDKDFSPNRINELETNLRFGTFYLRTVQDQLEGSALLASAGYNAGPGRPRSWRGRLIRPLEGAAFAEIIPFLETRGYVKAVLANTTVYAAMNPPRGRIMPVSTAAAAPPDRIELPSLKALLGRVQPGPSATATAAPGG